MPYVNIPESQLTGAIAKLVGKIEGDITSKVIAKANELQNKFRLEGCPSNLNRVENQTNKLNNSTQTIDRRLSRFRKLPASLKVPLNALEAAKKIILFLPIPQSVPPGFGIPVSITTKYADILHLLKEFIKQIGDDVNALEHILKGPSGQLKSIQSLLSRVNTAVKSCQIEKALNDKLTTGELTPEQLTQLGALDEDGGFIFSSLSPKLLDTPAGRSISDISKETGLSNEEVAQQIKNNKFVNDNEGANKQLLDFLDKLNGSNIPQQTKNDLKSILDNFKDVEDSSRITDGRLFYTGPDGTVYELKVRVDPQSPQIAPRRFAVALNREGVEIYKGAKSFSSSVDVLLDEIKFRIDNQLS